MGLDTNGNLWYTVGAHRYIYCPRPKENTMSIARITVYTLRFSENDHSGIYETIDDAMRVQSRYPGTIVCKYVYDLLENGRARTISLEPIAP